MSSSFTLCRSSRIFFFMRFYSVVPTVKFPASVTARLSLHCLNSNPPSHPISPHVIEGGDHREAHFTDGLFSHAPVSYALRQGHTSRGEHEEGTPLNRKPPKERKRFHATYKYELLLSFSHLSAGQHQLTAFTTNQEPPPCVEDGLSVVLEVGT